MIATSLTIGIGGSGGVFAPSLFVGATSGMAFGVVVAHLFGPGAGQPALYAIVGMGAVFASAARGPLTALASVVEMTGDFTLVLPVMLAVAISTMTSRAISYGTIYTTKLLRRGTDIDRATPAHAFDEMTVAEAMHAFTRPLSIPDQATGSDPNPGWDALLGPVARTREPQLLFGNDSLAQAVRQLAHYGRDGLPVGSIDGRSVQGWLTNQSVMRAVARQLTNTEPDDGSGHAPHAQLPGYHIVERTLAENSGAIGRAIGELDWPHDHLPVSVLHDRRLLDADPAVRLAAGDRISFLVPGGTDAVDPTGLR
jgi:CIC family chloride channel protein